MGNGRAALQAARPSPHDGLCALVPCLWRRLLVLDLAAGDIDYQLGELGGIAGRLRRLALLEEELERSLSPH